MFFLPHDPEMPARASSCQEMSDERCIGKSFSEFRAQHLGLLNNRRGPVEMVVDDQRVTIAPELSQFIPKGILAALGGMTLD